MSRIRRVRVHCAALRYAALVAALVSAFATPSLAANPVTTIDLATVSTASGTLRRVHGYTGRGGAGVPVATGGDCDGDGFVDYAMAAFTANPLGRSGAGEVYLVFGDGGISGALNTGVAQAGILRIAGDQASETAGDEIWIDDVTGDGKADLLIGRQNYTPGTGRTGAGALTIIVGGSFLSQHAATLQYFDLRSPPAGSTVTTFVGASAFDRLGIWFRTGDVTGDGIADIVVGADQEMQSTEKHAGAVYVVRGGAHLAANQTVDLASFGSTALAGHLARIRPPADSAHFHFGATCQIADLDGNGRAEVLVAAALNRAGAGVRPAGGTSSDTHAVGGSADGTVYIAWDDYFPAGSWPTGLSFAIDTSPGSRSIIRGGTRNDAFGEEILGGLDYDNDGAADLFVGDLTGDGSAAQDRPYSGIGHVLYSAAALKGLNFSLDQAPQGLVTTTFLGGGGGDIAADTALHGDFDGDGIADLSFSSPHADPLGRSDAGTIHVFHGQDGPWPTTVDLRTANLPSAEVIRITQVFGALGDDGSDAGDTLCYSAASGDVDGDGRTDVVTNEMLGNGVTTDDVGNLIVVSGALLDSTTNAPLRGLVHYRSSDLPVSGVTVDLVAASTQTTHTNAAGRYGFPVAQAVTSEIVPHRDGHFRNAVDSSDASAVLRSLVGTGGLDAEPALACDVTASGSLSALDAARIVQRAAGNLSRFAAATACQSDWIFWPAAAAASHQTPVFPALGAGSCELGRIEFDPFAPPAAGQSFSALLIGDCDASWQP